MDHLVQFYEAEELLFDSAARFVGAGLGAGENVVMFARASTVAALRARFGGDAIDFHGVLRSGQLTFVDAEDMLDRFMDGDMPDVARFLEVVGGVLDECARARPRRSLRVYGEMVDVLWRRGNRRAAIALEGLWNELARKQAFSLLCACSLHDFASGGDALDFDAVCWAHSHTIPADVTFDQIKRRAGTSS